MAIKYNMEFYTHITIPKTPFTFSYTVQTVLLGSCFAENIGKKLEGNKFKTDLNPFVHSRSDSHATSAGTVHRR